MSRESTREEAPRNSGDSAVDQVDVSSPGPSNSRSSGGSEERNMSDELREKRGSSVPSKVKLSRNEILGPAEFNKTIASWFGEKGFIAMRSFFRASVLNSLQKDPMGLNQTSCTDLDAAILTMISDYLVKKGKYFTMSVFSNEAIRPLVNSNPTLGQVLQRIGRCEEISEPCLTREMVCFVLRTLDVRAHSIAGATVLQKYFEDRSSDLLSLLMGLLQENAPTLNVKERAVRDDDVIAAFSEGLQEEMGKLHCWFSNFNNQFVDVSGKLKKLMSSQPDDDVGRSKKDHTRGEQELWNQMVRMDEHLKKQQECLMKMRDKEKKKLATYAKELEDLHQEMNQKLKSIQDFEKTLKLREKALREVASMDVGRGDHKMAGVTKRECLASQDAGNEGSRCSGALMHEGKCDEITAQIMQENLELKAILREQNLRIDALTKKAALLTAGWHSTSSASRRPAGFEDTDAASFLHCRSGNEVTSPSYQCNMLPTMPPSFRQPFPSAAPAKPPSCRRTFSSQDNLASVMSSALRRARMEIDSLRDEQNATDLQYDRLLHNKLSKRL